MFNKIKSGLFLLLVTALFTQACDNKNEYKTTESGLKYRFINDVEGDKINEGDFLLMNISFYDEKDSLLFSSSEQPYPMPIQYQDSMWSQGGQLFEGLKLLTNGDSIEFQVSAEDFYVKTNQAAVPENINKDSDIKFNVGVVDVLDEEGFMAWQMEEFQKEQKRAAKNAEVQLAKDETIIEDYLKENNIKAQKTESGLRYVVSKEGKGETPEAGSTVKVHYNGTLLDGTKFDSSYDRNEPLSFKIGMGQVIPGWDEGISLLKKGSKATLFVPSTLAYGERGAGNDIKPNSILVFEVELVDFAKN